MFRRLVLSLAVRGLLVSTAFSAWPALAQTYPNKPIKLIVPTAAGGGYDFVGRLLSEKLSAELDQPWVVENRTGTVAGTQAAAVAAPDGYTLLMGGLSTIAFGPALYDKLPFDPAADLVPVALVASFSYTLVSRPDFPASTLREVIDLARAKPGSVTIANAGTGSGQHVAAAMLAQLAGVQVLHVNYKGAQAAYTDVLGGRVDLIFDNTATARALIDAGRVKALAISSSTRSPLLPKVPTAKESGLPNLVLESWIGVFAPAKTPKGVIERLRSAISNVMQKPDLRKRMEASAFSVVTMKPVETENFVKTEIEKWPPFLRRSGIKPD